MSEHVKTAQELIAEEFGQVITPEVKEKPSKVNIFKGSLAVKRNSYLKAKFGGGVTTGYELLDGYFKFLPQQLYLLSAPTHHGKTMMSMNMCARIAKQGHKVLYASLEQGVFVSQFVENIVGSEYPESLWILDTSDMLSVEELLSGIKKLEDKPELLVVDHIHFLKKQGRGATEDIDEIILKLQNLAKELEMPVLAISHLRKLNADKAPEMDDLRDSSSLSQVPSVVMMIYRKKEDGLLTDFGTLILCKNRIQGKIGAFPFKIENKTKIEFMQKVEKQSDIIKVAEQMFS